jgi:hypothetical protein
VGINREMVLFAKGRPPKKLRERADPTNLEEPEYEEWVYGIPPEDVDFVRFIGDEVIRVETMKVDGQKIVRVDKEVDLSTPTVAQKQEEIRPGKTPTLRRPGEDMPEATPQSPSGSPPVGVPQGPPPSSPGGDPGPNWRYAPAAGGL